MCISTVKGDGWHPGVALQGGGGPRAALAPVREAVPPVGEVK